MRMIVLQGVLLFAGLSLAGCNRAEPPVPVHPVSGKVFYDGKPAEGVRVFLQPISAPAVPKIPCNPHGVTQADGSFTLTTYVEGDGAAEGSYKVTLFWPAVQMDDEEESDVDRLHGWHDSVNSRLSIDVTAGTNQLAPFRLPPRNSPPDASE